eukprot:GHRQ01017497.1.p3 GENE.GHRQ01017497.1~~GHRQ01017497.1.p3  ORF type:complete len:103 (-),score=5.65 GHRQ01017497.1:252-560(-)
MSCTCHHHGGINETTYKSPLQRMSADDLPDQKLLRPGQDAGSQWQAGSNRSSFRLQCVLLAVKTRLFCSTAALQPGAAQAVVPNPFTRQHTLALYRNCYPWL